MDEPTPDVGTGLPHHKKAWTQHDLLASTLSDYVDVLQKNGGRWPSWQIAPSSDNVHDDVVRLNSHLEKLGWMAKLTKDERWVLTVFPAPERQFPRSNTMLLFWVLSLLTLTLAGDHWMSNARPTEAGFTPLLSLTHCWATRCRFSSSFSHPLWCNERWRVATACAAGI